MTRSVPTKTKLLIYKTNVPQLPKQLSTDQTTLVLQCVCGRRIEFVGLSPNKLPCLFMVMRQRVINELNQASATQTMLAGSILNLTSIIREILCVQRRVITIGLNGLHLWVQYLDLLYKSTPYSHSGHFSLTSCSRWETEMMHCCVPGQVK